jgi:hypothetical protein
MTYELSPLTKTSSFTPDFFNSNINLLEDIFEVKEKKITKMETIKKNLEPIKIANSNFLHVEDDSLQKEFLHLLSTDFISPLFSANILQVEESIFAKEEEKTPILEVKQASLDKVSLENKKTKKQKVEETIQKEETFEMNRNWLLSIKKKEFEKIKPDSIKILLKTRCQTPISYVPDRLYSSLKYELLISSETKGFETYKFILAKIVLIDTKTFKEITDVADIIKGTSECSLISKSNLLNGILKIQLSNTLSHHHSKKEYMFEIRFFDPSNPEVPLLVTNSFPFKIFARKPNKTKKREREENEEETETKKSKLDDKENTHFNEFLSKLEDLMNFNSKLSPEEKKKAEELIISKLTNQISYEDYINDFNH